MSWAGRRRALILTIVFSVVAAVVAVVLIAVLYETPSCTDGKQNQDEEGVDCGGACQKVCTLSAQPPVVDFVRDVPGVGGRTDVIAYVTNPNADAAAKGVGYAIELFDENRVVLATKEGSLELPPGSTVPLFIPNAYLGSSTVAVAQMEVDDTVNDPWYRYEDNRPLPRVSDVQVRGTKEAPRVTAVLTNVSARSLRDVKVVATVFNEEDNAIAASQTVISLIEGQGSATATFTWSAPFLDSAARVEVLPLLPLP